MATMGTTMPVAIKMHPVAIGTPPIASCRPQTEPAADTSARRRRARDGVPARMRCRRGASWRCMRLWRLARGACPARAGMRPPPSPAGGANPKIARAHLQRGLGILGFERWGVRLRRRGSLVAEARRGRENHGGRHHHPCFLYAGRHYIHSPCSGAPTPNPIARSDDRRWGTGARLAGRACGACLSRAPSAVARCSSCWVGAACHGGLNVRSSSASFVWRPCWFCMLAWGPTGVSDGGRQNLVVADAQQGTPDSKMPVAIKNGRRSARRGPP